ncbi:DoxX family protein [Methyloligella sp. 2.7D]|uniref:DoxX family protein n=1 Tax=unclassified Methyloligella TaxID=2625955 RepID=UPI00157C8570|nr:DoxX family protein [Methyloligella sp. GL2]QKP76401.1 DoxX family protein [Methyloligella sp. GL2]
MSESASPYLRFVGRVLLAILFIYAGWNKIGGYSGTQAFMESQGVPGMLLPLVILLELGGGLAVLLGIFTRWSALALAVFCILAAILFHSPADPKQITGFLKDISIAGGFLVLAAAGPGAFALESLRRR